MVGNDIVDLDDPESSPQSLNPRFDTRVFSPSERDAIASAASPTDANRVRWRMWAAKEASYKLVRKQSPTTVFSPVRFAVELGRDVVAAVRTGRVVHRGRSISVTIEENDAWVHAVAFDAENDFAIGPRVIVRVAPLPEDALAHGDPEAPGRAVRALVCEVLAAPLGVHHSKLEVRRASRVPSLYLSGEPASADLSLSHHGRYVAFACALRARLSCRRPSRVASLGASR